MNHLVKYLFFLLPVSFSLSQGVKDLDEMDLVQSPRPIAHTTPSNYEVFFYNDINYTGKFEQINIPSIVATREYSMAGLQNKVRSVIIPRGFVVALYEHANESGGYGNYLELMEDCPDLAKLGLGDTVCFASVFFSKRLGGRYIIAKKVNDKIIPGYWKETALSPLKY